MKAPTRYSLLCTALLTFSGASITAYEISSFSKCRDLCFDLILVKLCADATNSGLKSVARAFYPDDEEQQKEFYNAALGGGILMGALYTAFGLYFCDNSATYPSTKDNILMRMLISVPVCSVLVMPLCLLAAGGIKMLKGEAVCDEFCEELLDKTEEFFDYL